MMLTTTTITFCHRNCLMKETNAMIRKHHWNAAISLFCWWINVYAAYRRGSDVAYCNCGMALVMAWLVWRTVAYQLWPLYHIRTLCKSIPENATNKTIVFSL